MAFKRLRAESNSKTTDKDTQTETDTYHNRSGKVISAHKEIVFDSDIADDVILKKRRKTNTNTMTVVTTTVQQIITTITTVHTATVTVADTTTDYYLPSSAGTDSNNSTTVGDVIDESCKPVKSMHQITKFLDHKVDKTTTTEQNNEYTTETTNVSTRLLQEGDGTLLDEYTVCVIPNGTQTNKDV
jgi:hypothetical protein